MLILIRNKPDKLEIKKWDVYVIMSNDKFRDPIHGFIFIRPLELKLINTYPFQRLRRIKQLALTYYVYHGAEHTRFGHSLGVMHIATRAFRSAVSKNSNLFSESKVKWLEQILRIIALTHDLGHTPFSHGAEILFPQKEKSEKHYRHEDLTEKIIKETEIADIIHEIGDNYRCEYGENFNITPNLVWGIYNGDIPGDNNEFTFLKTFMDSELDCDKMDYLLRDSYYCGVSYGKYDLDRLISCLTIFIKQGDDAPYLGIEYGGVQAFEEFVLARYFMFVEVYFHRTRRFFDLSLAQALHDCLPSGAFPLEVEDYLKWDDAKVIQLLTDNIEMSSNAKDIIYRKPWKCIYQTRAHPRYDGLELFNTVNRVLKSYFDEEYSDNFLVDKSAGKFPHKIMPKKHEVDEEDTIAIVNKDIHKISTISTESNILNNLTDKINIQRIYASEKVCFEAQKVVNELCVGTEDYEMEGN